jgi:ABC-type uncharacterized transport system fused permease/ATPase subunit
VRPDHLEKLNLWFMEQLASLKAEGTSEQDLKVGDVADLALRRIFEEHFNEIRTDEVFIDEAFAAVARKRIISLCQDRLKDAAIIYIGRPETGSHFFTRVLHLIKDPRGSCFIPRLSVASDGQPMAASAEPEP